MSRVAGQRYPQPGGQGEKRPGPSLVASWAKYALHDLTRPSCMSIVPCGWVSSTSSRTGLVQPGMAAPTRPFGRRVHVYVVRLKSGVWRSAARATTSLKVDPVDTCRSARGRAGHRRRLAHQPMARRRRSATDKWRSRAGRRCRGRARRRPPCRPLCVRSRKRSLRHAVAASHPA